MWATWVVKFIISSSLPRYYAIKFALKSSLRENSNLLLVFCSIVKLWSRAVSSSFIDPICVFRSVTMVSIVGVRSPCSVQPSFWQKQEGCSPTEQGSALKPAIDDCLNAEGTCAVITWGASSCSGISSGAWLNFLCVLKPCINDWLKLPAKFLEFNFWAPKNACD